MTINFDDFIKKYNGKKVEYHSYSSNSLYQCADLSNKYIVECLGLPAIIGTNAQDFPKKCGSNFKYIENTPEGIPQKGDLVIWSSADNVGHIAIFIDGDANKFNSFDQNYPTGSACHIQSHTYLRPKVIGWMRSLKVTQEIMDKTYTQAEWQLERDERNKNWDLYQATLKEVAGLEQTIKDVNKAKRGFVENLLGMLNPFDNPLGLSSEELVNKLVAEAVKAETDLQAKVKQVESESAKKQAELEKENQELKDELERLQNEFVDMEKKHQLEIETFKRRLNTVQEQITEHKEEKAEIDHFNAFVKAIINLFRKAK